MSSCTYKFKNASGEEVTITGQAEMKAFLADGGLEQLLPGKVLPWRGGDAKAAEKPSSESPFAAYDDVARTYGYEVREDGAVGSDGKFPGVTIKVKGGRLRVESSSGNLLGSYPAKPESIGKFLESFWYAEKVSSDKPAPAESPKVEAKPVTPSAVTLKGPRRDPTTVSMFNPYQVGDIVTIAGQDWQIQQDMPGWYLTNTGNWRGTHPTIQRIRSMADLIREIERASTEKEAPKNEKPAPAESPKVEAKPTAIDDFGTKLEGARKDAQASMAKEWTDDEIASQPFSKVWPAADIDAIEDPFEAALMFAARAEVPAKPRVAYKVKAWVAKVKMFRDVVLRDIGNLGRDRALDEMSKRSGLSSFSSKVKMLEALDRSQWKRIGTVSEYPDAYTFNNDGTKTVTPMVVVEIDGKREKFEGSGNVLDALDKINEKLGVAAEPKKMAFEVRGTGKLYFINKKGDKEYRKLKTFDTSKEAFAYIKDNYGDLVAAWEGVKDRDNVGKGDVRNETNRPRTGSDYRNGKDVTAEQFDETFGFRGVQFGNWVSQGAGGKDRQGLLNQAYDALMDLANIVGVPPKAISLNGSLGLAFGARGSGNASAHFEPSNLVINLTKTKGAGTLAHEWFHALDNYFSRQRGGEVKIGRGIGAQESYRTQNYITYRPEPMYVHKTARTAPMTKARLEHMRAESPKSGFFAEENWQIDPAHPQGVRPEVERAFADLVEVLDNSPMKIRSSMNDKGADGYWSRIIERGARAFENYVIHKMRLNGYDNDYLANVRKVDDFPRSKGRYPYLLDEEVAPVAEAFDNLFAEVKTKETDQGVAMFRNDFDDRPARAGWTESRIDRLIGEFAYDFDGTRTKAYAAFVNPDDFLSATTPKSERDKLEAEAKPLDREGLAGETQPIYLQVRETDEDGVFKIVGHEGRHRMMALRDAGYSRVPVALIFPDAVYDASEIEEPYFLAQKFGDGTKAAKGFSARSATPITSGNRAELVEEFSSNASGNNDIRFRNDYPNTQAFREWFGNSKMTNKAGEPLLFMHGSPASFEAFDSSKLGTSSSHTSSGLGHFFTRDRATAEKYADGGNIYTGWLKIEKPYVMMLEEAQAFDDAAESAKRRAELQKQGHDGVVILDDEGKPWATVAFEPWQFKSTDNNGSFDEFDDRMRFRDDPSSMRDATTVPRDQAEEFIRKFVAEYPGAPQIMLADSFYQLPEDIQSDALEQGSGPTRAKGALKNGKAYVVLNTHTSMADLEASVFHEVLGHAGIRKLLGPAFAQELNKMFIGLGGYSKLYQIMSRRGMGRQFEGYYDAVQRAREKNPEVWTEFLASSILTEEVFAHIAEQKNAKALRDRFMALVGMVRDWLRRNGFARLASLGESDIVFLLQRARAGLKNGSGVIRDGVTIGETVIVDAEGRPVAKKGSPDYEMLKAVSERMGLRETNGPTVFSNSLPEEGKPGDDARMDDTLTIDGVDRPTKNSKGQPIHPTEEGIRNFWRWFSPSPGQLLDGFSVSEISGLKRDTKALADFIESQSGISKSDRFTVIPSSVFAHVAGAVNNGKILDAVVRSLPVDVVNFLGGKKGSAKEVLHNAAMLEQVFSVDPASDVSLGVNPSGIAELLVRMVANAGAKISGVTSGALERNATVLADTNYPILGGHIRANQKRDLSIIAGFGDSKVVDAEGRPLVVYHGTKSDFDVYDKRKAGVSDDGLAGKGFYFTYNPEEASGYAESDIFGGIGSPNVQPVYVSLRSPLEIKKGILPDGRKVIDVHNHYGFGINAKGGLAIKAIADGAGHDGVMWVRTDGGVGHIAVFNPEQIKSATGNAGTFDPSSPITVFRTVTPEQLNAYAQPRGQAAKEVVGNLIAAFREPSSKIFNVLHKTISTPLHKASISKDYDRVFRLAQDYQNDIARFAAGPADAAPRMLPSYDSIRQAFSRLVHGNKYAKFKGAVADAIFEGTLAGEDVTSGRVWTDAELRDRYDMTDDQIGLYREARDAVDASLDSAAAGLAWQAVKKYIPDMKGAVRHEPADAEKIIDAAMRQAEDELREVARYQAEVEKDGAIPKGTAEKTLNKAKSIAEARVAAEGIFARADALKAGGYAPLMRFGKYAVDAVRKLEDGTEERITFMRFESELEAKTAAQKIRKLHPDAEVKRSIISEEAWKIYKGVDPELVSLFAESLDGVEGLSVKEDVLQEWYRNAVSERSSFKRMIHRKGTDGFDRDITRVLASFITSNSRLAARQFNMGDISEALADMNERKVSGDVLDDATGLKEYIDNPEKPFKAMKGMMFAFFLGGSVASAALNLTQPMMMTFPYLSQYGARKAGAALRGAAAEAAKGSVSDKELGRALSRATKDGIVDPQQIHHLYHESLRSFLAKLPLGEGLQERAQGLMTLWGMMFGATENFNRRLTFIAAYRMAKDDPSMGNPYDFAAKAVEETQGIYNDANIPNWARGNGSFGALGVAAFTFKQYSIGYVELLIRLAKSGKNGRKGAAIMLGTLVLMSGMQGAPGADDLEDVIDTVAQYMGYTGNSRLALRKSLESGLGNVFAQETAKEMAHIIMYGGLSVLPGDLASRTGLGNLFPATAIAKPSEQNRGSQIAEIFGPPLGMANQVLDATLAMESGAGALGVASAFAPVAVRNWIKAYDMASTGQYRDTKGRKVVDVTAGDVALKAIGIQPTVVSDDTKSARLVNLTKQRITQVKSAISSLKAQGIADRNPEMKARADAMVKEWNEKNPDATIRINDASILKRVKEINTERRARLLKAMPKDFRATAAESYSE